jgi:GTP-binding protein
MIPRVAIVGRPNVGKSSILNMLAGRRVSIVDPTAGVTRDRVSTYITLPMLGREGEEREIELIDTGGYGIEDSQNLTAEVEQQIAHALAEAAVVLFVVDAQQGIVALDERVARLLHTSRDRKHAAPVVLVANKTDSEKFLANAYEAMALGFGEALCVSATTNYNKNRLFEAIESHIDWDAVQIASVGDDVDERARTGPLLAIVGKRNAGKSSLVNALAGSPRVIVSEVEGTTRDSVDVRFEFNGKVMTAIDTAGLRKGKSVEGDIEYYSQHRSLRSVRRADVVVFVMDATVAISQVDRKLSTEIQRHFKPTVIVVNKWDLVADDVTEEDYAEYLEKEMRGLDFAPIVFTSAVDAEGVEELVAMAWNLYQQAGHRVTTGELNRALKIILAERGPSSSNQRKPKIYYATQLEVHPPTVALFVNDPLAFNPNYQRYLIHRFRDMLPFAEVPIKLLVRDHRNRNSSPSANTAPRKEAVVEAAEFDEDEFDVVE